LDDGVSRRQLVSIYRAIVWVRLLHVRHTDLRTRDLARIRRAVESGTIGSFEEGAELDLYLALWHSMLYAVIETWKGFRLSSPDIDSLLADERISLLKDFRNAILHPRDCADARIDALATQGDAAYPHFTQLLAAFEAFIEPISNADRLRRARASAEPEV
jgi:hypothetical protein